MKQIIVSIHDVTPFHRERLQQIEQFLAECGLEHRYSMLVVPDFWRRWPLADHPEFGSWLRARAASGVEMLLHGFTHRDETQHRGFFTRWKAQNLTAREGEFLGLSRAEALDRLAAGKALVEGIVERPVSGFVAPAWLYGAGTHAALRELGFAVAEDQLSVWSPATGRVLSRVPVVSYASRSAGRIRSSLAWSKAATVVLSPCQTVRVALHPDDFAVPALIAEARRAISAFTADRSAISYLDLARARSGDVCGRPPLKLRRAENESTVASAKGDGSPEKLRDNQGI